MGPSSKAKCPRWALTALLLSCLLLAAESSILIHTRWVEDESWVTSDSWSLAHDGKMRSPIFPESPRYVVDVAPPAHPLSVAASFAMFGTGVTQARAVSAVAAIGVVIVVFLLALELGGPACAALASVLIAADTFLVIAARTARSEAETTLFSWLALLLYFVAARRGSRALFFCSGAACGLGMLTHPAALPFAAAIGIFFLMRRRWTFWRDAGVWMFAAGVALPLVPYAAWCFSDAAHIAAFRDVYMVRNEEPWGPRLLGELDRWSDFIGLGSQRVALPIRLPLRLHVAVILAAAYVWLWRRKRDLAIPFGILFCLNVLWWAYLVNKGPRYHVLIAPLFALTLGYAAARLGELRAARIPAVAALGLVLGTQVAGNAYWLYKYRSADYTAVTRDLRKIIPPGAKVFGATTFWMALHDHDYYAYDRTTLNYAVNRLHADYLILNDRVMVNGSGHGSDDFAALRAQAEALVRERGTLAGTAPNDFYGDLRIYRVAYPAAQPQAAKSRQGDF